MNNDLISRSRLLEEVTRSFDAFIQGAYFRAACDAMRAKRAVIRMLNDAPAVDAEVVRHGRWILNKHYGDYECSECGVDDANGFTVIDFRQHRMNYCPNCGAKMDGDVNAD